MTQPGVPTSEISFTVQKVLGGLVSRVTPTGRRVGFYLLVECHSAWVELHAWLSKSALAEGVLIDSVRDDPNPAQALILNRQEELQGAVQAFIPDQHTLDDDTLHALTADAVALLVRYLQYLASIEPVPASIESIEFAQIVGRANLIRDNTALPDVIRHLRQTAKTAEDAARLANERTAELAAKTQAHSYKTYGSSQNKFFWGFNVAAVAIVIVVGIAALKTDVDAETSVGEAIMHVATLAIALGLAAYLARQGARFRTNAAWSESVSVQLDMFDAFISPVESMETRDQMRLMFAARAFGSPPEHAGGGSDEITWIPQILNAMSNVRKAE